MKLIFQNNIEPISCTLSSLVEERVEEYRTGDRLGFPSFVNTNISSGTLLISDIRDINRIRNSFRNHFILTDNNGRTCFADCMYSNITISTYNSPLRYDIENYECKLDFRVIRKGSRSIPITESELSGCYISIH